MPIVPGAPVTPDSVREISMDQLTFNPTPSASAQVIVFDHLYGIYVDNVGVGGGDDTRLWISTPDAGDVVIGPRASGQEIATLRLKTDRTTGSAANMHIDSATFTVSRSTSSKRYKQDIADYAFDLEALRNLRIVSFHDISEVAECEAEGEGRQPRTHIGLLAEEVDGLGLTEVVGYDSQGRPDWVQYDRLALGLIQLAQEQERRIADLESRLAQRENAV